MQLADYAQLLQLWQDCDGLNLRDADSPEGIDRYLQRNPGLSFVAVAADGICGSLMAGHDGRRGYIQHLAVAEAYRRQGIAGELIQRCLDALLQAGIVKSHVHVQQTNAVGLEFWRRRGWVHRDEVEMFSFINSDNENA